MDPGVLVEAEIPGDGRGGEAIPELFRDDERAAFDRDPDLARSDDAAPPARRSTEFRP